MTTFKTNKIHALLLVPGLAMSAASTAALAAEPTSSDVIQQIIVTATKRDATLQEAPLAISVVGADQIAAQNLATVAGLQHTMPNLQFAMVTGTPQLFMRGVGGGGRNVGFDPRVGVYVDGVYIGNTASLDAVLVGLERAEVLRGPQGFLFGAASDAGAISLVTRAPTDTFSDEASVGYGSHNRVELSNQINVPLSDNIFANLSLVRRTRDGYITNLADGRDMDYVDETGARGRLRIEASENTTVDFALDWSRQKTDLLVGTPLTDAFGFAPSTLGKYQSNQTSPEFDKKHGGGLSATVKYSDGSIQLTSISAFRTSRRQWDTDTDHDPLELLTVDYRDSYDGFSQEFTVASADPSRRMRYLVGAYLSQTNSSSNRQSLIGADAVALGIGSGSLSLTPHVTAATYSAYASFDYDVLPNLTLNIGGRLSQDDRKLVTSQDGSTNTIADFTTFTGFSMTNDDHYFVPTAGLTYQPNSSMMLYGKYSGSQKPGGFNADFSQATDPNGRPYAFFPEKVQSVEVGMKSELFGRTVTANVAAFWNSFEDYQLFQVNQTDAGAIYIKLVNAGKARTYGVELELQAHPVRGLDLSLSASRIEAEYQSFPDGGGIGVSYSGNRLEYAPQWSGSASVDYSIPFDNLFVGSYGFAGIKFYARSNSYGDPSNDAVWLMDGSQLLDARIGFGSKGGSSFDWEVALSGENLLGEDVLTNISIDGFGGRAGFRETPRRYMGKLTMKF